MDTIKDIIEKQFYTWNLFDFKRGEKGIKPLARATFCFIANDYYSAYEIAEYINIDVNSVYRFIKSYKDNLKSWDKRQFLIDRHRECVNLLNFINNREEILKDGFEIITKHDCGTWEVRIKSEEDFIKHFEGIANYDVNVENFDYNNYFFEGEAGREFINYDPEHSYEDIRDIRMLNYKGMYFDLWCQLGKFRIEERTETVIVEVSKELEEYLVNIAQDLAHTFIRIEQEEGIWY